MMAAIWGTLFHDIMMFIAIDLGRNPPKKKRDLTLSTIKNLIELLPCQKCRNHGRVYFEQNLEAWITAEDSDSLVTFLVQMHNNINKHLGKKHDWTVEDATSVFFQRYFSSKRFISIADQKRLEDHKLLNPQNGEE